MLPPCPITRTAPGSLSAAIASLISFDTFPKSVAGVGSGGLDGVAEPGAAAADGGVVFGLPVGGGCAASPREHAATNARQTIPTAAASRIVLRRATPPSELSSFT